MATTFAMLHSAIPRLYPWGTASPLHGPMQLRLRRAGVQRTEALGNVELRRCRNFRSWCVSTEAANWRNEVQSAEELREQLEALQQEAEQVRGRANGARLRFMRLTHVVEQLRQRAAVDVRMGKEDSARLLLTEKQKVMKALEAARQRAELLEQLAGKLNVAISMKETVLIEVLSSAPVSSSDTSDDTAVHHVSPSSEGASEETVQSGVDDEDDNIGFRTSDPKVKRNEEDHNLL